MSLRPRPLASAALVAAVVLGACGGKTGSTPGDAGVGEGHEAGQASDGAVGDDGGTCIDVDTSTYDLSCQQASDCITVSAGRICDGYSCLCGGSTINASGQARYEAAIASLRPTDAGPFCECPASIAPHCLQGTCVVCDGLPSDPPECHSTATDAGADGAECVDVDLSTYDRSCASATDCIGVTAGVICPGQCQCGGAAVNQSEQNRYRITIDRLGAAPACPCFAGGPVGCVEGQCVVCNPGGPACPDGG
jgi:hypothetical protein